MTPEYLLLLYRCCHILVSIQSKLPVLTNSNLFSVVHVRGQNLFVDSPCKAKKFQLILLCRLLQQKEFWGLV
jgi:hypothetical protein